MLYDQIDYALSGISSLTFVEAHWLLAFQYLRFATHTRVYANNEQKNRTSKRGLLWAGVFLCAIPPIAYGYFNAKQVKPQYEGGDNAKIELLAASSTAFLQILYITLGVFMIICLLVVSRNMKKMPTH